MNFSRRRKRLQSAAGARTRRTQTRPKSRRADEEMVKKRATVTGSALTSTTAVSRTTTPKTRAATGSGTRIKTKDESKTGTRRRTKRGIEKGKKTKRETEKRRERGIPTKTGKETRTNEETETKSGRKRESDTNRGKRGTKMERVAVARYAT